VAIHGPRSRGRIVSAVAEWYDTVSQGALLVGWIRSGKESPGLFFHDDVIRLATWICQIAAPGLLKEP